MLYLTEKEKAILTAVQQIRQGRLIPKTCLVCNAPIEQSYNGGHVRRYCKKAIGKLTEGWTDFTWKGGNLH